MNFFDYGFIFFFMPAVVAGAVLSRRLGQTWQFGFLILASVFFYCTWETAAPLLLVISICLNYLCGHHLHRNPDRMLLAVGVGANLAALGYYKYSGFFAENLSRLIALPPMAEVILPLGISFFTFQQISYLVDSYRRQAGEPRFLPYALFISFFPHLVAGPIVLQSDLLRQLQRTRALLIGWRHIAMGLGFFIIGLAKKLVIADSFAAYATPVFAKAAGAAVSAAEAWQAALAYTFQIYFDFSGYSDMAIGLAFCLGVRLPFNFASPYRSLSIAEFWRRWHMSLSRFLRHYLYIPLGGSRGGLAVTYRNLLIVMMLGGLWHGASWNFVLWGGLHGGLLVVNHAWRRIAGSPEDSSSGYQALAWTLTFTAVVFTWVPFRAPDMATTLAIWRGMIGLGAGNAPALSPVFWTMALAALVGCLALPNSQQIVLGRRRGVPADRRARFVWRPTPAWGFALGLLLALALAWTWPIDTPPEFIYFNF